MWPKTHTSVVFLSALYVAAVTASAAMKQLIVATDGSGDFKTVQEAVDAAPSDNTEHVLIRIKPGRYKGKLVVPKNKPMVALIGDDAMTTVLTNDWNAKHLGPDGKVVGTGGSTSVLVAASDFLAENVTFENTAGDTGQAVALSATGDRQVFRNCRLLGWQDTLYANGGRQLYDRCYIEGHTDFIFGKATAVFDHCELRSKHGGYVTAASTGPDTPWGYIFLDCKLTADGDAKAFLGRPWRPNASVTFVRCQMGEHIDPRGWDNWRKAENERTARYAEYASTGLGANPTRRVKWSKQLTREGADEITVNSVLGGADGWKPADVKVSGR